MPVQKRAAWPVFEGATIVLSAAATAGGGARRGGAAARAAASETAAPEPGRGRTSTVGRGSGTARGWHCP